MPLLCAAKNPRIGPVVEPATRGLRIKINSALRRECLDRLLFWTATDLELKLCSFKTYYNEHRVHSGLGGKPPDSTGAAPINLASYGWQKHCRGLYQTPIAA